ncbi:hypothetical protein E4K72_14210 [Oxalobacteraceae bacterium OM1]|nr:hypothetical protein E4K72_14210 [Oxalobacteraceae bacterium OM1]
MRLRAILAAFGGLLAAGSAAAGQFYLFPVKEIEGLVPAAAGHVRPLVDERLVNKLFRDAAGQQAQRSLVEHFVSALNNAYPNSTIHPRQVYDVNLGSGHKFLNDDQLACKQTPSYNVADTYGVVIGITRASVYEVARGGSVEVLVPVTLNLQFIKPNLAKTVYTISETLYSPFRFSRAEYESGSVDGVIRDVLVKNIKTQVSSLVASARAAFNPQDVAVKLVDRDGKFLVADKGFEAGFAKGEQVEARDGAGKVSIFDVLYADNGYAVLKTAAGSAGVGDTLQFVFDRPADDSRKPRLMPVVSSRPEDAWSSAISDIFSKDIGFQASFHLSPVDVNFTQTKELITRAANCVTWQKIPAMAEASGERKDPPNFFIRFTPAMSPVANLSGKGGTRSAEIFHTLVTAQIVDTFGRVVFSEIGDNDYTIERTNGEGLALAQAREVSLKNAAQKLARNVVANVRFEPKEYRIARVTGDRLWIEGLNGVTSGEKLAIDVLHPLSAKAGGKPVVLDLDVGPGAGDSVVESGLVGLPYSVTNPALPKPERGDVVRVYANSPPGLTKVADCREPAYIGQNNLLEVDYLAPIVRHALYRSARYASYIGDPAFYADANGLLRQGLFDLQVEAPQIDLCSQPGYAIREEATTCDAGDSCKAAAVMGIVARFKKGQEIQKTVTSGLRTEFTGFPSAGKRSYIGYKQLGGALSMQSDFINKLNAN